MAACSHQPQIGEQKQRSVSATNQKVIVERMYATSVSAAPNSGIENLFDDDPSTKWKLVKGAGVNEGLMIYFESPVMIEEVMLEGGDYIESLLYFVDGKRIGDEAPGRKIKVGKKANSLFIKINTLQDEDRLDYILNRGAGWVIDLQNTLQFTFSTLKIWGEGGQLLNIQPLKMVKGSVEASSSLLPQTAYNAAFLFDSRNAFGWAEGDKGSGEGQTLKFNFDKPVKIEKIKIWNGYQRSDAHFSSNCRLKGFQFGAAGSASQNYTAPDQKAPASISLNVPVQGQNFELKINSVFPGARYKDLVISELRFFDGQNWFGMETDARAKSIAYFQDKTKGSPLAKILDQNLHDGWYYEVPNQVDVNRSESRQLLLRSDGTFVLYLKSSERTSKQQSEINQVADGNWEVQSVSAGNAKIKIFGKLHRILDKEKYYVGKTKNDKTKIFKEFLTVKNGKVYGEKLVDSIRIERNDADFVYCDQYVPLEIDLRYLTGNNFMKMPLYADCQQCITRQSTAKALGKAHDILQANAKGKKYQFLIWDAYRPYSVQKLMWEKIKDPRYVADPYNGGSSHNKGTAVDISIVPYGSRESIPMGTDHDHFGDEAHWSYKNLSAEELANRALLKKAMEGAGFKSLESEWWHWSLKSPKYPIADIDAESCGP